MMSNVVNYTYIQVQINGTLNEPYKSTPANSHPNSFHQQPHNHDMSLLRMICTWVLYGPSITTKHSLLIFPIR